MRSSNLLAGILVMLALTGCGGGGSSPAPTLVSIAVTPLSPSIAVGSTQQFTATGTYSNNTTQNLTALVTWTSTNTAAATISATGLARGVATGTTTVTAASGTVTSSPVTMTVTPAALSSIAVTPANPSIAVAGTVQFTATGTYTDGSTQNLTTAVTWSSLSSFIATISTTAGSNGLANGVNPGTTTIRAASGAIAGTTMLTVTGGGAAANVLPISVNGSLCAAGSYLNKPCVSVTICDPMNPSNCQTINDILLDTGSYGLRLFNQVVTVPLPQVTVASGNLAECVKFGDGSSLWGPVQTAVVVLGGEPAVTVPIQVVNASFPASGPPAGSCGTPDATPAIAGFNGILGAGLFAEDCGTGCSTSANNTVYFACTGTTCSGSAAPLASQVQNPVAHLPVDNNGVLVQLPAIPAGGAPSVSGQLLLGIGTQANNTPSGVTAYPANVVGDFTTVFNGTTLSNSFIDSGSNGLFFSAPASLLPTCASPNQAWYCPSVTTDLSATNRGAGGTPSGIVNFQIRNALGLFSSGNRAFTELGGVLPAALSGFDWGLPFFYGRSVFVGIEGRSAAGLGTGPYWAY
jgi:Protein of unknown function (DUF3443)/Bacterial Ig-like domain (group 2)